MSTPNIEELRQLAQAATPGIWFHIQRGISRWHGERIEVDLNPICDFAMLQDCCVHEYDRAYENAAYIQAANPSAIIGLIDTIQAQAERIKVLEGGVTHWKALREAAVNVANDRREERDTLAADNARLRTLVIGLQTDAERYRHAKLYDLLDGWDDESIDRDIRIHNLVVNAAIKGGV